MPLKSKRGSGVPEIESGDASKVLAVKSDESGAEWSNGYVPTSSTTTTPTASSIPIADSGGKIADGWVPDTIARLASPALTGSPTAPTQAAEDDSTKIATTEFVKDQEYFNKTNILGTVSQSGGIPTGAVIERGNNSNGEYVKFADGTMICTGIYAWINADDAGVAVTYPANFASGTFPVVAMRCFPGSSTTILIGSASTTNNTTFELTVYQITGTAGPVYRNGTYTQPWFAIGRWF